MTAATRERLVRGSELLPVAAALALNATTHGRWALAGPLIASLALCWAVGARPEHRRSRLGFAALAGAVAGGAAFLILSPPVGPIPPVVLSPLCAALSGASGYCALSGRRSAAWIYAWILAAVSANVGTSAGIWVCLVLLGATTLLGAFVAGRGHRVGAWGGVAFITFCLLTGLATWKATQMLLASERMLMGLVYRIVSGAPQAMGEASVDLPPQGEAPLSPEPVLELSGEAPRHLRLAVLELFDGRRWTSGGNEGLWRPLPGGTGKALELVLLNGNGSSLPAPAGVLSAVGAPVEAGSGFILRSPDAVGRTLSLERGDELLPEEPAPKGFLELPDEVRTQLSPLADELLGDERSARAQAQALERHFAYGFEYSLAVDLRGEGHPLAVLVRERRPAYCAYFASAMAALLRTRGVPARLVVGYAPREPNRFTGRTMVRLRDAHAWVEVYLADERRWRAFDPTPFSSRDAALGLAEPRGVWQQLAEAMGAWFHRSWAALRNSPGELLMRLLLSPVLWTAVALAALAVFGRRRIKGRIGQPQRAALGPQDPQLVLAYARYLQLLRRAGLERAPPETDEELLARVRAVAGPGAAEAAQGFVGAFRRARFRAGEQTAFATELAAVDAALRQAPARPGE